MQFQQSITGRYRPQGIERPTSELCRRSDNESDNAGVANGVRLGGLCTGESILVQARSLVVEYEINRANVADAVEPLILWWGNVHKVVRVLEDEAIDRDVLGEVWRYRIPPSCGIEISVAQMFRSNEFKFVIKYERFVKAAGAFQSDTVVGKAVQHSVRRQPMGCDDQ